MGHRAHGSGAAATAEDFDLVTENTEFEPEDTGQFILLRGLCVFSVNSVSKKSGSEPIG